MLPFVLTSTLILLISLAVILTSMITYNNNSEENKRFKIAISGDTDNDYMKWGMSALQAFDETRFSVDFVEMSERKASKSLANGDISAYVVLPENFMENAMSGDVEPIKYVTTPGAGGVVTMFKNEVTKLVTDMVVYSEKGAYGINSAVRENGVKDIEMRYINKLSMEYIDLILDRADIYSVETLGVSDGLSMSEYYICGIIILLLMLMGLPYITVHIKKDYSLNRLLASRGYSGFKQLICEYISHILAMLSLIVVVFSLSGIFFLIFPDIINNESVNIEMLPSLFVQTIPTVIMLCAFNIMIFELSDNIVSGVLTHFFTSLSLCYITGCFYPVYSFPKPVQYISAYLPTGIARAHISCWFTGENSTIGLIGVLVYTTIFLCAATFVRRCKMSEKLR